MSSLRQVFGSYGIVLLLCSASLTSVSGQRGFRYLRSDIDGILASHPSFSLYAMVATMQEDLTDEGYELSFGVLLWDAADSPGTTSGQYEGVHVHLHTICNVPVPSESCREIGSALTFEGYIGSRSIRGMVSYYPISVANYQYYYAGMVTHALQDVSVDGVIATCASAQSRASVFDKTTAARCIANRLSGVAIAVSTTGADVPRSVAVVSGASADTFPDGLHIRNPYQFSRDGRWLSLLVIIQP